MVFKQTRVDVADRSGAGRSRVIHTYYTWVREFSITGAYVKVAVESLSRLPPRIRGRRYRPMRPGFVVRALLVTTAATRSLARGSISSAVWGAAANAWVVRKRGVMRSKYYFGICQRPRVSLRFMGSISAIL